MASPPPEDDGAWPESAASRSKYSVAQVARLEQVFRQHKFVDGKQTVELSRELGITIKQTRTWFQNRRATIRRQAIRAAGKSYVPNLQLPTAGPRGACTSAGSLQCHDSRSPSPGQHAAAGNQPRGTVIHGPSPYAEVQGPQPEPSAACFGTYSLAVPRPARVRSLSPSASSISPVPSSGEEDGAFPSAYLRPNMAAIPGRHFGSYDSLWPRFAAAPPINSAISRSAPCISPSHIRPQQQAQLQYWPPECNPPPPGPWLENTAWQQVQASHQQIGGSSAGTWTPSSAVPDGMPGAVGGVLRRRPPLQTDHDASSSSAGETERPPSIATLTSLVLEMETAGIGGGAAGSNENLHS
ncbi:uncharacterized protein LOC144149550 [Haemaphysalis longicornis]